MLALTLSVGFVVDDAIVMLENIVRHIEGGMRPFEAALKGSREIGFTIISITFALIAVFIPVLLMGGMVGRVFREFAVTIAVAIILSGFVSLTLTPMLCARVLKSHHEGENQNIVLRIFEAMFRAWLRGYEVTLDLVLKYRFVVVLAMLGTLVGTVWLYIVIPKGFFPTEDTGFISATVEGPSDISFTAMYVRQQEVAELLRKDPGGRLHQFHRGQRRSQSDQQQRTPVHRAQAAQRARRELDRGHSAPARQGQFADRGADLLPERPEHQHHRPRFQERVPIHDAVERHRLALPGRARNAGKDRRSCRGCATSPETSTSRTRR